MDWAEDEDEGVAPEPAALTDAVVKRAVLEVVEGLGVNLDTKELLSSVAKHLGESDGGERLRNGFMPAMRDAMGEYLLRLKPNSLEKVESEMEQEEIRAARPRRGGRRPPTGPSPELCASPASTRARSRPRRWTRSSAGFWSAEPEQIAEPEQSAEPEQIAEPEQSAEPKQSAEPEQSAEPRRHWHVKPVKQDPVALYSPEDIHKKFSALKKPRRAFALFARDKRPALEERGMSLGEIGAARRLAFLRATMSSSPRRLDAWQDVELIDARAEGGLQGHGRGR
jgi:hypothetical protein